MKAVEALARIAEAEALLQHLAAARPINRFEGQENA